MNIENIQQKPTIYMANYPSNYVEYMTHGLFGDKFCLLVHHGAMKGLKYIYGEEYLISVQKGNFEKIQKQVKKKIEEGFSIFCYVERDYYNRKSDYNICELRSGIFSIAKNINATITPVCIDHITYTCGIVDDDIFKIKIGDTKYVFNVEESLEYVKQFLKNELKKMKSNKIL
jgi:hypothetical protein